MRFKNGANARELCADLYGLNDTELQDIGITRGEVDYVVSNRSFDREESGPPIR